MSPTIKLGTKVNLLVRKEKERTRDRTRGPASRHAALREQLEETPKDVPFASTTI
jgi:hypothetical protein